MIQDWSLSLPQYCIHQSAGS